MRVEVIICTYNRVGSLQGTIQSILDTETPENVSVELFIINNNSSDATEQLIKEFTEKASGAKIKYLFEGKQGKSYALNTALKHITGDIIAFTDDDIIVDKNCIKEMVKAIAKYPQYNCFGGRVLAKYNGELPEWLDIEGSMKFLRSVFSNKDEGDEEREYGNSTISGLPGGCHMFFRREVIEKNGLFRTDLGPLGSELGFSEDVEYCQRLLNSGNKFMYIPAAIMYHPAHQERLNKGYLLKRQYKCGRAEVRKAGGYENAKKAFGVPRYLFGKILQHAVGWGFSLQVKTKFYHKLKLYYTFGEAIEHICLDFNNSKKSFD